MEQAALFNTPALTVSQITTYLRQLLESDEILQDVWVRGEVSNLSRPNSGHVYFTLKDAGASLRCVIWRTTAQRLKAVFANGSAIEAHGYIGLYERDGQYQLYIDALRLAGEGWLYQEFLRLKARLEAEGLFDPARKRPIPARPRTIGIVTSPTGAALQDMLNTLAGRYPLVEVILAPTAVQGDEAPEQIVRALQRLNRKVRPDVILLARGGGSLEDLWAFNDERVVRAVVASAAPVITGIGHETDFTLADFAADLRAPTPTGAAVLATPNIADLRGELRFTLDALDSLLSSRLEAARQRLAETRTSLDRLSPWRQVQNDRQRLDELYERIRRALTAGERLRRARLEGLQQRLEALNPLAVLQRGFAVVHDSDGRLVGSIHVVSAGDDVSVRLADGSFGATVRQIIPAEGKEDGNG
jgi:exodeoxyribonuclease VII large subunit